MIRLFYDLRDEKPWVREMMQWAKVLATKAWGLVFKLQNPCKGGKEELTPQGCPLLYTLAPGTHVRIHIMNTDKQ